MFRLKIITFVSIMALGTTAFGGFACFAETAAAQQAMQPQNQATGQATGQTAGQPNGQAAGQPRLNFNPGTPLRLEEDGNVLVDGQNVPLRTVTEQDMGFFLPDGEGGMIWSRSGRERPLPNPDHVDAREFKLQVRELAEQLLANIQQSELRGKVGMPTSFVNQDNFEQSSAFGRYIAEQMYHEFNQRGFAVRDYRIGAQRIKMREGEGDFYLTRERGSVAVTDRHNVVLVGTYYQDGKNVFINARLIRPSDGLVYRTGQMVMQITPTTKIMLAKTGRRLEVGTLGIQSRSPGGEGSGAKSRSGSASGPGSTQGGASTGGANLGVLDQSYDIH